MVTVLPTSLLGRPKTIHHVLGSGKRT